jgi:hypothetical protein
MPIREAARPLLEGFGQAGKEVAMVSASLALVIEQAERLAPDERAQLVAHLTKAKPGREQALVPRRK